MLKRSMRMYGIQGGRKEKDILLQSSFSFLNKHLPCWACVYIIIHIFKKKKKSLQSGPHQVIGLLAKTNY